MAKKMRRFLAWIVALTLITGQIAIPTAATETEGPTQEVKVSVDVTAALPEAPGATSQAPAASGNVTVTTSAPVTTTIHDPAAGIIEESTSTTTTWSGTEGNTTTTGTETTTTVTGTDDYNGTTLYEGGTTAGSETSTTTTTVTETNTETVITKEETAVGEGSCTGTNTETTTTETSTTTEGEWKEGEVKEGQFIPDEDAADTEVIAEEDVQLNAEIPEDGVTIVMTPDTDTEDHDFFGQERVYIPLEEGMSIPEDAELIYDEAGESVIGYWKLMDTTSTNNTTSTTGDALRNEQIDTQGTTTTVTPDLENLEIPIYDSETTEYGEDGSYTTTKASKVEKQEDGSYVVTNEIVSVEVGEADIPERPDPGVEEGDGYTTTTTVEDVVDEDGSVIGFTVTETRKDADGTVVENSTKTYTRIEQDPPEAAEPVITFTLPEKPAGSTTTDAEGNTTTVTVTEITDADGKVIGYKSTTVKTDAKGNELFYGEEDIYGETTTVTENVNVGAETLTDDKATYTCTITETFNITANQTVYRDIETYTRLTEIVNDISTTNTYEIVELDGKLYMIYVASMTVSEGEGHGDTSLMNPITAMSHLFNQSSALDLDAGGDDSISDTSAPEEGFKYLGHGIDSALSVNKQSGSTSANQFRLKSEDGKIYFALCIDYDTNIKSGHLYDIEDIKDADYLNKSTAEKIRSIALNGYWGTESGVGSMADVQALLIDYLTGTLKMTRAEAKAVADSLTPGQALAATQAALWKYGDSGTNNPVQEANLIYDRNDSHIDEINAEYLYNALIAAANDPNAQLAADEGVEFLDADDVTGGSITLKSKVISEDEAHANNDADPSNDVYNTDIGFTLGIEPSKLNGDLIVTVSVGGEEVKKVRLAGADDPLLPLGRIVKNEDGSYTIPDVEVAAGVTVTLNLSGAQELGTGVYIYTSLDGNFNDSQTLVTLATGQRQVNLNMDMTLNLEAPGVTKQTIAETTTGSRTDTKTDTKVDETIRTELTTKVDHEYEEKTGMEGSRTYKAGVTLTRITTKETKEERLWKFSWLKTYDPEGEEHDDDIPTGDDDYSIPDEEVPLAAAPKTGDISGLWAVISMLSLAGSAFVARRKED